MKKLITILVFILAGAVALCQKPSGSKRHSVTLNPNSGYMNINELTYGYGLGSTTLPYSKQFFGLTTMHGYQLNIYGLHINHSLLGGIGTGILFYNGGALFPLYLDLRFVWNSKKISPYVFGNSGLILNFEDLNGETKIFINGGGGVLVKIDDSLSASFGTGLLVQMGSNTSRDAFVNLKAGVVFKPR